MSLKCPRSYLLGFFFGDGGSEETWPGIWQHTFYVNEQDYERVNVNAQAVGVQLNWRAYAAGNVFKATWPKRFWNVLELPRFQGYNGRSRRTSLLPLWVNENSFMEGIWDADGSARIRPERGRPWKAPKKKLRIKLINAGLIDDLDGILRKNGLDPTKSLYWLDVRARDYERFRQLYTLQPYKQTYLDRM